ncbi:MAG: T9SS type A sorting domain-containing protein [Crocinitomicaceae bacterium]|nr:T9SS type A sorting domain-containing protein [Crocinitomicaceae bacterium]
MRFISINPSLKFSKCHWVLCSLLLLPFTGHNQYTSGESYFGANNYVEYIVGDMPIIIVAPHGGYIEPETLPIIGPHQRDNGTLVTSQALVDSIVAQTGGCRPHLIINHLHPTKMNPTHDIDSAAGTNLDARQAWNDFHNFIEDAKTEVTDESGKGHYFEIHGNGHAEMWTEIGLGVSKDYLNDSDSVILSRVGLSTVKNLCTVEGADFLEIIQGPTSLGGLLDARGWNSVPSPSNPAPGNGGFFYAGWNTWLHGSRYSGTIDATHIENYYAFMQTASRAQYAGDLAESILIFMEVHYGFLLNCNTETLEENTNDLTPIIYPNPTWGVSGFQLLNGDNVRQVRISNAIGMEIERTLDPSLIFLKDADAGVYIVSMDLKQGFPVNYRVVVR